MTSMCTIVAIGLNFKKRKSLAMGAKRHGFHQCIMVSYQV